jgi:hypothetical protein
MSEPEDHWGLKCNDFRITTIQVEHGRWQAIIRALYGKWIECQGTRLPAFLTLPTTTEQHALRMAVHGIKTGWLTAAHYA